MNRHPYMAEREAERIERMNSRLDWLTLAIGVGFTAALLFGLVS